MKSKSGFEMVTCSRCGGSGHYSYNQISGTVCFKCGGKKAVLTARGRAAWQMYEESLKVPVESLAVGEIVQVQCMFSRYFAPIVKIEAAIQKGASLKEGVMVPYALPVIDISTEHSRHGRHGLRAFPGEMVRKGWSGAEKQPKLAAALAYQETLTKAGTVRKTREAA